MPSVDRLRERWGMHRLILQQRRDAGHENLVHYRGTDSMMASRDGPRVIVRVWEVGINTELSRRVLLWRSESVWWTPLDRTRTWWTWRKEKKSPSCRKKAKSIAMGRLLRLHCDRHCVAIDYLSDHSNGRFRLSMDSQWALQGLLVALTIVCTITLQQ